MGASTVGVTLRQTRLPNSTETAPLDLETCTVMTPPQGRDRRCYSAGEMDRRVSDEKNFVIINKKATDGRRHDDSCITFTKSFRMVTPEPQSVRQMSMSCTGQKFYMLIRIFI